MVFSAAETLSLRFLMRIHSSQFWVRAVHQTHLFWTQKHTKEIILIISSRSFCVSFSADCLKYISKLSSGHLHELQRVLLADYVSISEPHGKSKCAAECELHCTHLNPCQAEWYFTVLVQPSALQPTMWPKTLQTRAQRASLWNEIISCTFLKSLLLCLAHTPMKCVGKLLFCNCTHMVI